MDRVRCEVVDPHGRGFLRWYEAHAADHVVDLELDVAGAQSEPVEGGLQVTGLSACDARLDDEVPELVGVQPVRVGRGLGLLLAHAHLLGELDVLVAGPLDDGRDLLQSLAVLRVGEHGLLRGLGHVVQGARVVAALFGVDVERPAVLPDRFGCLVEAGFQRDRRVGRVQRETVVGVERVDDLAQRGARLVDRVLGRAEALLQDRVGVRGLGGCVGGPGQRVVAGYEGRGPAHAGLGRGLLRLGRVLGRLLEDVLLFGERLVGGA